MFQIGRICQIAFFLLSSQLTFSQRFGGNPPSIKWSQINTDTVRVIFPEGMQAEASRVVTVSHHLNRNTRYSIGSSNRKIDIVLQSQTIVSNGYVGLAPWRSEFYMTPMQNSLQMGSLPWTDNLAVHEYRHVQQYMNFNRGLSRFAFFLMGEQGQALANSMAIPNWFYEGDAVFQETAVTPQGRGRLPDFFNGYRSLWESGKQYPFAKLRNGSMKDYVPDYYQLGYLLITYGRVRYGPSFWKDVARDAVSYKPFFYPLQGALKKYAGIGYTEFRKDAFAYFRNAEPPVQTNSAVQLTKPGKGYVKDYTFPKWIGPDSLLVLKRTYRELASWYILSGGKEIKLAVKDISLDDYYNFHNGKIIYTTYRPDLRWSWKDFSDIVLFDIQTGRKKKLSSGAKYFSPDLSPDGRQVVAVNIHPGGRSDLHLLDASNGNLIRKIKTDSGYFHTYPCFSKTGAEVYVAVRNRAGQMALVALHIETGRERIIVPFSYQAIAFPVVRADRVIFSATHHRRVETWCWNEQTGRMEQLASHYTGSYQADLDQNGQKLVYSRFTADGMQLFAASHTRGESISPEQWAKESTAVYDEKPLLVETAARIDGLKDTTYPSKTYRAGYRIFNFHSWLPYYEQPDWSISLRGENVLNTFRSELYYNYNENEKYHKLGFNGVYSAWYPWLTGGLSYTFDRQFTDVLPDSGQTFERRWDEFNANLGLRLPLNFSGGLFYRYLTLTTAFNTQQLFYHTGQAGKTGNSFYNYIQSTLSWSEQIQQARQQIFPRFAYTTYLQYRATLGSKGSSQFLATGSVYLPGVGRNHSVVLNGAFQARDTTGYYIFTNNFPISRGYPGVDFPRMWKVGGNYHLPLVYPDLGFAQMVYFQRIRANLFYDATNVKSLRTGLDTWLRSVGTEIYFDSKWWNEQPISFGIRYSRLLDADKFSTPPGENQWEFILPVNLVRR
jgi:hypothetical protein